MFSLNIEVLNTTSFIQKFMFSSTVYLLKGTSSVILKELLFIKWYLPTFVPLSHQT